MASADGGNIDRGSVTIAGQLITLTPGDGRTYSISAPPVRKMRMGPQFPRYHIYSDVFEMGPKRHFHGPGGLWRNLTEEPAPRHLLNAALSTSNTVVPPGGRTTVRGLGTVSHYFNPRQLLLVNVTVSERHTLHPGAVLRLIAEAGNRYVMVVYGIGNGPLGRPNDWMSASVWGSHTRRLVRETIFEEARGERYPDPRSRSWFPTSR
jgi:hypothetical protein